MLIATKETEHLIGIVKGTGDNPLPEDKADGFIDYVMTSIYHMDGDDIILDDSGQLLLSQYVEDLEEEEIVRRVLDYWELNEDYIKAVM